MQRLELHVQPIPPPTAPHKGVQRQTISAFLYAPSDAPGDILGGIVLIQEIFGVNDHIRAVASRYASKGYMVLVPAFYDHMETGVELDYRERDFVRGRDLVASLGWETALRDVAAAIRELRQRLPEGANAVAAVGYCWGGSLAFLAACRLADGLACAVSYYGRHTFDFRHESARCPVLFHFGGKDSLIPQENVQALATAQPEQTIHIYDAGHGFNCEQRADYNPEAAHLAEQRSLDFLRHNLRRDKTGIA